MTIELVDGKAGTAHISSGDKAIIHQAKFGAGDMVFEWGDAMSCTMQSANKAVIGTGCASIQGLDWHITNPETVTIQSGSSGKNRNDIICAHYHRETSTGVEKVELVAFKGVPSDAAAVDPTIPSAKISEWEIPKPQISKSNKWRKRQDVMNLSVSCPPVTIQRLEKAAASFLAESAKELRLPAL